MHRLPAAAPVDRNHGPASPAPAPLRIALISSQAFSLHNFRGPLIRDWVASGHAVFALAPDFDDESRRAVAALGARPVDYRLERAAIRPVRDAIDLLRLAWRLRGLRLDHSLAYFIKPVIYGTLAARLAGVGRRHAMVEGAGYVFSDPGGPVSQRRKLLRRAVTALYRVGLRWADAVFFLNRDDIELFVEHRMVRRDQVVLLGGIGVELKHFAPAPSVTGPVTFLLAARLLAHKGVREYVEAARQLRAARTDARFLLLGSPDLNPGSIDTATLKAWHAEGVVEWHPHVGDVRPWMARASVFVLPSWYREGVPRSIQEAMAMGRAVVTTDMPGCRDTVEEGISGWLVPPRDVDALAAAMRRFVERPALVEEMGRAARARAERCFDVRRANGVISRAMGLAVAAHD